MTKSCGLSNVHGRGKQNEKKKKRKKKQDLETCKEGVGKSIDALCMRKENVCAL